MAKEDGSMSIVTTPVSPVTYTRPTYVAAWEDQGTADTEKIRAVYATFTAADEETINKLLGEIA